MASPNWVRRRGLGSPSGLSRARGRLVARPEAACPGRTLGTSATRWMLRARVLRESTTRRTLSPDEAPVPAIAQVVLSLSEGADGDPDEIRLFLRTILPKTFSQVGGTRRAGALDFVAESDALRDRRSFQKFQHSNLQCARKLPCLKVFVVSNGGHEARLTARLVPARPRAGGRTRTLNVEPRTSNLERRTSNLEP